MNQFVSPSTNFNRVRDGRNAPDAYFDVDLTNTFDTFINVAGNSFYVDANPADGNAIVYFQETDALRGPTPFYISPGFIARIPFTQIRLQNVAPQPGRKIRIVYGVDTDFQPGSVSQVSFAGVVSVTGTVAVAGEVSVNDIVQTNNQHFHIGAASPIGVSGTTIVAPAANLNGIAITGAYLTTQAGASGVTTEAFFAALVSPANLATGTQRIALGMCKSGNGVSTTQFGFSMNRIIPAGWGLFEVQESISAVGRVDSALEYRFL